ncbi:hypothetical protein FJTKL_00307 [Diaporthe vaccinii]|uniref:Uncharacterized protein n=1 Tax=Diaporthe vaccinii TaxID=105482 RepID=A0ABR4E3J8_9PEZI
MIRQWLLLGQGTRERGNCPKPWAPPRSATRETGRHEKKRRATDCFWPGQKGMSVLRSRGGLKSDLTRDSSELR